MPIYEYACESCGHTTELLRRVADADEPTACESCGSTQTHRAHSVFSAAADTSQGQALPMGPCGRCGDPAGSCAM